MKTSKSFDDILLEPQFSDINSRLDVDISKRFLGFKISIPILSTNMSTITEADMMIEMHKLGASSILHRFNTPEEQVAEVQKAFETGVTPIIASIGVGKDEIERAKLLLDSGTDIICIDIAHGHCKAMKDTIETLKKIVPKVKIIAGNIATKEAFNDLVSWGADAVRVGIGGGSRCITRTVTGHGIPNLTALIDIVTFRDQYACEKRYVPVIMDGGIKNSGDIVKAIAFGADLVSIGNIIAGTEETPGDIIVVGDSQYKKYYGMASKEAQETHKDGLKKGTAAEGFSEKVSYKGPVANIIEQLAGGIRSGLTYSGARNIAEFIEKVRYVELSGAAREESKI